MCNSILHSVVKDTPEGRVSHTCCTLGKTSLNHFVLRYSSLQVLWYTASKKETTAWQQCCPIYFSSDMYVLQKMCLWLRNRFFPSNLFCGNLEGLSKTMLNQVVRRGVDGVLLSQQLLAHIDFHVIAAMTRNWSVKAGVHVTWGRVEGSPCQWRHSISSGLSFHRVLRLSCQLKHDWEARRWCMIYDFNLQTTGYMVITF